MAMSKKARRWTILSVAVVALGAFFGYRHWKGKRYALPKGIASGNGRIEALLVDTSAKESLRVLKILVAEGDLVKPGQVLVQLDTSTLEAELAESKAKLAAAQENLAAANSGVVKKASEVKLAAIEENRSRKLAEEHAGSQREHDVRTMALKASTAALSAEQAKVLVATRDVEAAQANVATVQSRINDATLTSPVVGRVLYKLAEPGEVLGPGGKALTLVNLQDVYMEIFLPSRQAAALKIGADARITVDYAPNRAAVGYVSFVSPEAQFTPKEVETKTEREKLMFRVKIQVPAELVTNYIQQIKTGVRGVGYVKVDPSAAWPDWLQKNLVRPPETERKNVGGRVAPEPSTPR
jgi:HlyD family secretion protein